MDPAGSIPRDPTRRCPFHSSVYDGGMNSKLGFLRIFGLYRWLDDKRDEWDPSGLCDFSKFQCCIKYGMRFDDLLEEKFGLILQDAILQGRQYMTSTINHCVKWVNHSLWPKVVLTGLQELLTVIQSCRIDTAAPPPLESNQSPSFQFNSTDLDLIQCQQWQRCLWLNSIEFVQ